MNNINSSYKIEFPISNYVCETERSLSAYIDLVSSYLSSISSLYFPLGYVDTGIDIWGIRAPSFIYDESGFLIKENVIKWENAIQEIVSYTNLPVKILMNNTYNTSFSKNEDLLKIEKKLLFYNQRYSIDSVVIADTRLIPFIRNLGLDVCLSTNSYNNLAELDMIFQLYSRYGIKEFVLQRDLNRQPNKVKSYLSKRNIENKIILMVNEGCINACPYKESGDIEISIDQVKNKVNQIHRFGCSQLSQNEPWTFLTSQFLTFNMLRDYYPNVTKIKISGRDKPVSALKYYLKHWVSGNNLSLSKILNVGGLNIQSLDLEQHPTYIKDTMSCNKECYICSKCREVFNSINTNNLVLG